MSNSYLEMFEKDSQSVDYWKEYAILSFTEELARKMEEKRISQTELARRLGSSAAYVSQALNGTANFTIGTMTKLAHALESKLSLHIADKDIVVRWEDLTIEQAVEKEESLANTSIKEESHGTSNACVLARSGDQVGVFYISVNGETVQTAHG